MENITLGEWLDNTGASWHNKYLDKWLDLKVTREISSADQDQNWHDYLKLSRKYFPNHKYVFSFITLENGWAVGFNENPSHGWSFPHSIEKYDYPGN